jgi:ATP-binding cassette subfamily B protein
MFYVAIHNRKKLGLTVGDFALLQAYLVQVFDYLWDFGRYIRQTFESLANANELTEMLEKPIEVLDSPSAEQLVVHSGEIDFRNVNFAYDGGERLTLSNFNLSVPSGMRIALVGESGAGKSTIAKLLLRFADVTSGGIYIDGMNIANVTQQSLRESIAVVSQDTALFHRTLLENIRYGRPEATDEEVIAAAKAAHCHEFISRLPLGYNTLVGERGVKLSGGERQRIAIARAILKNSQIVFLDEATSALDSESEALIQDALAHLMAGKTLLVIAHRLSTIKEMDTIMVLSDGQVVESGSHDELLQVQGGRYRALWTKQSGGFIAAASPEEG